MKYQNPILRGFNPDPSVCRVGEDFYLVTSTFEYFPGIPVYHSQDLVNWELIGHCIDRPEQLPSLETVVTTKGIWAPTIRYNEGTFYVTATCHGIGNFIVSAKDPAGPWSDPVFVPIDGIDPSLFFENGKAYYCTNQPGGVHNVQGLSMVEIDVTTGQFLSDVKYLWGGTGGAYAEAPHIYHIGDWYYAVLAEGGTFYMHMVTIARSKNIWGPYEPCPHNPLITNRHDQSRDVACTGHGELFDDAQGNWWIAHLGTRTTVNWSSQMGRETFLMPITWQDGWPVVEGAGMSLLEPDGPILKPQELAKRWKADLSKRELPWIHLRIPREENYQWSAEGLRLIPVTDKISDSLGRPTMVALRQYDMNSSCMVKLEFEPMSDGDEAGLTAFLSCTYHYKICKRREKGKNYIVVQKKAGDFFQEVYREEVNDGQLTLCITGTKFSYSFGYSIGNDDVKECARAASKFLSWDFAPSFTGVVYGVYTSCEKETNATALIKDFQMER